MRASDRPGAAAARSLIGVYKDLRMRENINFVDAFG